MTRSLQGIEDMRMDPAGVMVWRYGRTFLVPFSNITHVEFIKVEPA